MRRIGVAAVWGSLYVGLTPACLAPASLAAQTPPSLDTPRIGLEPIGGPDALTQVKDQVEVRVLPIDVSSFRTFRDLALEFSFVRPDGRRRTGAISICQAPFFRIELTNLSDRTLRIVGLDDGGPDVVIVAVEDPAHQMIEANSKAKMKTTGDVLNQVAAESASPTSTAATLTSSWNALIESTPLLSGRANVLPGRSQVFIACFDYVPEAPSVQALVPWFKTRPQLTFGLYDVPVARNDAGVVTKKSNFAFAFNVKYWLDHYEYSEGTGADQGRWVATLKGSKAISPDDPPLHTPPPESRAAGSQPPRQQQETARTTEPASPCADIDYLGVIQAVPGGGSMAGHNAYGGRVRNRASYAKEVTVAWVMNRRSETGTFRVPGGQFIDVNLGEGSSPPTDVRVVSCR